MKVKVRYIWSIVYNDFTGCCNVSQMKRSLKQRSLLMLMLSASYVI